MSKKAITIRRKETRYILEDKNGHRISVIVHGEGKSLSIYKFGYFNQPFVFENSHKETIEAIAKLLLAASKVNWKIWLI